MRTAQPDKRTRLIETATKLAYGRGFRETSLADIAEAARVPVGNVYYYFKTKEELAEAVVERRLEEFRAEDALLAGCARSCTKRAALSRRNPRRSSMSPCVGLRSSSGPLAMKRIHENSRSICSPPFRAWRLLRSAPTTARWW